MQRSPGVGRGSACWRPGERSVDRNLAPAGVADDLMDPVEYGGPIGPVVEPDTAAAGIGVAPRRHGDDLVAVGRPEDRSARVAAACSAVVGPVAVGLDGVPVGGLVVEVGDLLVGLEPDAERECPVLTEAVALLR